MKSLQYGKLFVKIYQEEGRRKLIFLKINVAIHTNSLDTVIDRLTILAHRTKNLRPRACNKKFWPSSL